jgi:hypothetical protein
MQLSGRKLMPTSNESRFLPLEAVLRSLSLREHDFASGDAIRDQIALLKSAMDGLDTTDEPWLATWLSEEHYKAATLYAAGKTNWNHEQLGRGSRAATEMRARIVQRFNAWAEQFTGRLQEYQAGSLTASSVTAWLDELARFRRDPVRNP